MIMLGMTGPAFGIRCTCGLQCTYTYRRDADRDTVLHALQPAGCVPVVYKLARTGHWLYPVIPQPVTRKGGDR